MSHQVETMAFANETPWHGLGHRVDPAVSVDEMIVAAGLNWRIDHYPTYTRIDNEEVELAQHVFVRDTDKRIMTIASERWTPLQNNEAMEFFRDYTREGGATLETAGSLRGGRVVWGLASLGKGYIVGRDDQVQGYLLMIVPHEVGKSIQLRVTSVRVVCANTMAMAIADNKSLHYRQSHIGKFNVPNARLATDSAIEQFMNTEAVATKLSKLYLSTADTQRVLKPHFQPDFKEDMNLKFKQVMESIQSAPGAMPNTGWGILNGVIHWCDHVAGKNRDTRLTRSWMGKTGRIKEKVQTELLRMAS